MIARGRCSVNATTFSRPTCAYLPGDSLCTRTHCAGASEYPREQYPRQSGYEGLCQLRRMVAGPHNTEGRPEVICAATG